MQRREFLKISSLGIGGLALSGTLLYEFFNSANEDSDGELKRFPTYCEICFWQCAGWTHLDKDKKIWKIIGNDDDPHSNGRLCPRGTGGIGSYYDKDRLKKPLIRINDRGKQSFREASWEEAFDLIAKKMKEISAKYGPESMALFHHGSGGKYFTNLLKAFGSDNIAKPSFAQCMGPREVAYAATFGTGLSSPEPLDIRDTKCLVLIGSHLGENMHNAQVQEMSDAIDKGASIITVDPRFSTAASKSKFWLPIKPATDIALLLSWINVIIANEWYDKEFVELNCEGFDQLKQHVESFTPEWAFGITTIEPDVIVKTAKAMHDASPAVIIHPGRHTTWYGDDTQRLRAVAILNALLGSWGKRGGFFIPDKASIPHHHLPAYPKPAWTWKDTVDGKYNLVDLGLANVLVDTSIPKKTGDNSKVIKGWFVVGTNLINTLPNTTHTLKAIQNLDLIVAVDTMPMEITGWADVILPECTYLERYDSIRVSQNREGNIALRMPATKPLYDTKPAWWMARELGIRLGLKEYFPFKTQEEELDWELTQIGSSLKEMKQLGVKKIPTPDHNLYIPKGETIEFNTNSGKIELYSSAIDEEGFPAMPVYTKHPEPEDGFYRLIYGRAPMHTFSRTANNPNLTDLMDENTVWINPKIANLWDLKENQYIKLKNQDGIISTFSIKVRVTERIRIDSVYMVHGFGHADKKLTQAYGRGASDTEMITNVLIDPIMGGTGMRGNFVTFITETV
jgi:thiosulfate reductase/polysulfide reductase chain A